MLIHGSTAQAMGNYFFTDPDGDEVKVEYTFGYVHMTRSASHQPASLLNAGRIGERWPLSA